MSRTEGSFKISGALEPRIASALDARTLVQTKAELTASGNFPYPYVGLEVYVISENKKYRFIGSDTTDINDWEEVGSGGGSDIQVDTLPTASIDELGNIYQYVGVTDTDYTNGCFYECVSDGQSTPTYSWEMKPVMPSLEASDMADIVTPLPTGGRVTGFTPIGTIIPMIAETAPLYYLKCDGATYNKSDYPELAAHLLSMTNHSMYEVSGDNTKFKVPDLSGEFLRGTGANSHTNPYLSLNEGSGLDVGVHQPASVMPGITQYGGRLYYGYDDTDNVTSTYEVYSTKNKYQYIAKDGAAGSQNDRVYMATTRPTNTSVLYCIATKDIYIDARNIYSTTEKVVGEWIDGKPVYQKTIQTTMPSTVGYRLVDIGAQVKRVVFINAIMGNDTNGFMQSLTCPTNDFSKFAKIVFYPNGNPAEEANKFSIIMENEEWVDLPIFVTIQYTKTTD